MTRPGSLPMIVADDAPTPPSPKDFVGLPDEELGRLAEQHPYPWARLISTIILADRKAR